MAGTTVKDNDNVHAALIHAMAKGGYKISREEANDVMGYPKPYAIEELLKIKEVNQELITPEFINQLHNEFLLEMLHFYEFDASVQPIEDAEFVFDELHRRGVKVALDTGFSRDIAEVIVRRFGWLENGKIDVLVASDDVPQGRPFPYMIRKAMDELQIDDVLSVAKVGDTVSDLLEGKNTGCAYTIGITSGAYDREVLAATYHTHLVGTLSEILPILFADEEEK